MKIVNIFAVIDNTLYSVVFDVTQERSEFSRLFDFWNDAEQLRNFFEKNKEDLNDTYWEGITIEEAINKTREEAKDLERLLLSYATGENPKENLSMLFKPLSNKVEKKYEKDKAKVSGKKTWLRLYAVRIDVNLFVVCGGAIKLRKTMNDRDYLKIELEKLDITQKYLRENDADELDFVEL